MAFDISGRTPYCSGLGLGILGSTVVPKIKVLQYLFLSTAVLVLHLIAILSHLVSVSQMGGTVIATAVLIPAILSQLR